MNEDSKKLGEVIDALEGYHRQKIAEFAEEIGLHVDEYLAQLDEAVNSGEYVSFSTGENQIDFPNEVWEHYQALRMVVVSDKVKENVYYHCSC
jgi:hypothetical protein